MAPQNEMEKVLIDMRMSRRSALQWFMIGSWFFLFACFVVGWNYWEAPAAVTISFVVAWSMWELRKMERSMRFFFRVPPIFTSRFFGTTYDPYSEPLMGDLMSDEHLNRDLAKTQVKTKVRYVPPSARRASDIAARAHEEYATTI